MPLSFVIYAFFRFDRDPYNGVAWIPVILATKMPAVWPTSCVFVIIYERGEMSTRPYSRPGQ